MAHLKINKRKTQRSIDQNCKLHVASHYTSLYYINYLWLCGVRMDCRMLVDVRSKYWVDCRNCHGNHLECFEIRCSNMDICNQRRSSLYPETWSGKCWYLHLLPISVTLGICLLDWLVISGASLVISNYCLVISKNDQLSIQPGESYPTPTTRWSK